AGDLARVAILGRDEGVGKARVLGTVAAEKVFDVLFLLISAGLTARLASLPPWLDASLVGTAVAGGLILAVGLALPRGRISAWAGRLPGRVGQRLGAWVAQGVAGLAALRRPRMALGAGAWSAAVRALAAATNALVFLAFDLSLPIGAALLVLTLLHVGTAPPSSPARVGVFHALVVVGLEPFGVARPAALACAAVLHLVVYGPQLVLGTAALAWRRGN
ncbi:MAG: lysylphosphatidylglycerol synthase transmembrane domain-containing protein, partial [Armatimonadota bacterium]